MKGFNLSNSGSNAASGGASAAPQYPITGVTAAPVPSSLSLSGASSCPPHLTSSATSSSNSRSTFLMRAQVNNPEGFNSSFVKRSPMGRLARLAKKASGNGTGNVDSKSTEPGAEEIQPPPPPDAAEPEPHRRIGSDKFNKSRSPIQCLNPMQLQAPSPSNVRGPRNASILATVDVEVGGGQAEAAKLNVDDNEEDEEENPLLMMEHVENPMNRFTTAVEVKETKVDNGKEKGNKVNKAVSGSAASSQQTSASSASSSVPGLKTSRNSNSGWL